MTVNVQKPYVVYEGDGVKTLYTFEFGIVESADMLVIVGGVLMLEYSAYTIQNVTDEGGEILFVTPPAVDSRVTIVRRTTITQQVDYTESPFQAETHEFALDKITFILQELLNGGFLGTDSDGNPVLITFDLSVTQNVTSVTINNTGGTDAEIPPWASGTKAGVFHGEITETPPVDGSETQFSDGYVIIVVAP